MRAAASLLLAIMLLACTAARLCAQESEALTARREAAVVLARGGDAVTALGRLKDLLKEAPDDGQLLADTVVVAVWAHEDSFAVELFQKNPKLQTYQYATNYAAHAARNLGALDTALDIYRIGRSRFPDDWGFRLGEVLVLTDQGKYAEATELMKPIFRDHPSEPDVIEGVGYLCAREGDIACALGQYQNQKIAATRGIQQCTFPHVLAALGAPTLAEFLCPPTIPSERLELSAEESAEQIHWGQAYARTHAEQLPFTKFAVNTLGNVVAQAKPESELWQHAQFDLIVGYTDLWRFRDAANQYERLVAKNIHVPDYALIGAAEAYSGLHMPQKAAGIYQDILKHSPLTSEAYVGLSTAYVDMGRFREGFRTIDKAVANSPGTLVARDLADVNENPAYLDFALLAAQSRGYAGLYAQEQAMLQKLERVAPANPDVHYELADTYRSRGWYAMARDEVQIGDNFVNASEQPSIVAVKIAAESDKLDEVDAMLPKVVVREGQSPEVKELETEVAIQRGWQFDMEGYYEHAYGQFLGTSEQYTKENLYSPLYRNRWRVFGSGIYESGTFTQGDAQHSRAAAGVSYGYDQLSAYAGMGVDNGSAGEHTALFAGGAYKFNDTWKLKADFDTDSFDETQLIATLGSIQARTFRSTLDWRPSDLEEASAGFNLARFTDGNWRDDLSAEWERRMYTVPRFKVTAGIEGSTESNTLSDTVIYFNPTHDLTLGPNSTADWLSYTSYKYKFDQKATVFLAPYWQSGFGTGAAWSVNYSPELKIGKRLTLEVGVTYKSQPYNGVREGYTGVTYGVKWGE